VGKPFRLRAMRKTPHPRYEVMGVVHDSKYIDLRSAFGPGADTSAEACGGGSASANRFAC
jgi:hypothetical protein